MEKQLKPIKPEAGKSISEKKKQKVYKKLNFLLQTENQCVMIQISSGITELHGAISKELKIKESCPIGRTGRKETIWRLH